MLGCYNCRCNNWCHVIYLFQFKEKFYPVPHPPPARLPAAYPLVWSFRPMLINVCRQPSDSSSQSQLYSPNKKPGRRVIVRCSSHSAIIKSILGPDCCAAGGGGPVVSCALLHRPAVQSIWLPYEGLELTTIAGLAGDQTRRASAGLVLYSLTPD